MEHPPKLFDLTLLQVECNRKFAFSADTTLKVIQSLYEKKVDDLSPCRYEFLPNDIYPKVPGILKGLKPYVTLIDPIINGSKIRKSSKVFNDKKITDHHAIIPTGVFSYDMTPDEKRVYDLGGSTVYCGVLSGLRDCEYDSYGTSRGKRVQGDRKTDY